MNGQFRPPNISFVSKSNKADPPARRGERKQNEAEKWQSIFGTRIRDEISLVCTAEEFEMLREFLEPYGINIISSVYSQDACTLYVRNPYKEATASCGDERCKRMAELYFERYKGY